MWLLLIIGAVIDTAAWIYVNRRAKEATACFEKASKLLSQAIATECRVSKLLNLDPPAEPRRFCS